MLSAVEINAQLRNPALLMNPEIRNKETKEANESIVSIQDNHNGNLTILDEFSDGISEVFELGYQSDAEIRQRDLKQITELKLQLENEKLNNRALAQEILNLKKLLGEKQSQSASFEARFTSATRELTAAKKLLKTTDDHDKKMIAAWQKENLAVQTLQKQLNTMAKDYQNLAKGYQSTQTVLFSKQTELTAAKQDLDKTKNQLASLENAVAHHCCECD